MFILMSQKLQIFAQFQKIQLDNLVDFEKCCKTRIYLQRSAPIQPKTSENLPKFCQKLTRRNSIRPQRIERDAMHKAFREVQRRVLLEDFRSLKVRIFRKCIFRKCIFRKFCKFLAGSFSAVSKRNFARKYAFDSIFQALQDLRTFAPLQFQNFKIVQKCVLCRSRRELSKQYLL